MTNDTARAGLDLEAIEEKHPRFPNESYPEHPEYAYCNNDGQQWPCDVTRLLAEVRQLRAVAQAAREWRKAWRRSVEHDPAVKLLRLESAEDALMEAIDALDTPHVAPEATQKPRTAE